MGRYAMEPDNATKSAKARGSNLRVHFKVSHRETLSKTASLPPSTSQWKQRNSPFVASLKAELSPQTLHSFILRKLGGQIRKPCETKKKSKLGGDLGP